MFGQLKELNYLTIITTSKSFTVKWQSSKVKCMDYCRNIVREPQPNMEDRACTAGMDAEGRVGPAILKAFTERQTEGGGPTMWVNLKYRCPLCESGLFVNTGCCTERPEGFQCKPDADTYEDDPNVISIS